MTIPHDPEKRWWIEVSSTNTSLVDSFRPALITFLAFDKNRIPTLAGTGFILASTPDYALAMTAKHVFTGGVMRAQRPHPGHATSAIFIHNIDKIPSLEPEKLKVMWMGSKNAALLNVSHACYNESLDLASCTITPQQGGSINELASIPLDIDVPKEGEVVHMVSMDDLNVQETTRPAYNDGKGQRLSIYRKISIRVGVVTAVYPQGFNQYRWPCFTTSIPANHGMSGGFVYRPREGKTIAACGVVCADPDADDADSHNDHWQCAESIVGCSWPALALRVPLTITTNQEATDCTIHEMISKGKLPKPLGDFEKIRIIEGANGDCRIEQGT